MKNRVMTKRIAAVTLCAAMTASMAMGCGNSESTVSTSDDSETVTDASDAEEATQEGAEEAEEAEEVEAAEEAEEVPDLGQLTAITIGTAPAIDLEEEFYPALDAITQERWGFTIRFDFVSWGETSSTYQTKVTTGDYDLYTVGPWGNYTTFASQNAFYDLSTIIDQVPDLVEKYGGQEQFDQIKINDKLCYIPQYQGKEGVSPNGITYRTDVLEDWGISAITDMDSLDTYLKTATEKDGKAQIYNKEVAAFVYQILADYIPTNLIGISEYPVCTTSEDPYTAIFSYETPEYLEAITTVADWYESGVIDSDIQNTTQQASDLMISGVTSCEATNHLQNSRSAIVQATMSGINGESDTDGSNPEGVDIDFWAYPQNYYVSNMGNDTGLAINSKCSEEVAVALLKFIEAVHTEKDLFDLFQYGIEGVTYDSFPTDDTVSFGNIETDNQIYRKMGLGFSDTALARSAEAKYSEVDDKIGAIVDDCVSEAQYNPLNGFIFDKSNVENEILAVTDAMAQTSGVRCGIIPSGMTVEEAVDDMCEQLKAAGIETIIEELQTQIDEYVVANGK